MRKTFRKIRLIDVIIAEVHRSPWVRGPGESWMELIPAVEFPNFDIDEYDEYTIFRCEASLMVGVSVRTWSVLKSFNI